MKAGKRRLRFDSPFQEAYLSLWRTFDRLRTIEEEAFGRFDLTGQQYNVLRLLHVRASQPLPTLALAERLVSRAPDITRILDKLEARKLVYRTRSDKDRRSVHVGITPAGTALLRKLEKPLADCEIRQLGHMDVADLGRLIELLHAARAPHEPPGSPWA